MPHRVNNMAFSRIFFEIQPNASREEAPCLGWGDRAGWADPPKISFLGNGRNLRTPLWPSKLRVAHTSLGNGSDGFFIIRGVKWHRNLLAELPYQLPGGRHRARGRPGRAVA